MDIHYPFGEFDQLEAGYTSETENTNDEEHDDYLSVFLVCARNALRGILAFIIAMVFLGIISLFTSCSTKKYVAVPVPEYHSDTVRINSLQRDSIYLRDSIFVNQYTRGDTVYNLTERWHTYYNDRLLRDTAYFSRRDTVTVPMPGEVTKEVPAQLTKFQQLRMCIGDVVLVILANCLLWWIISKRNWFRQLLSKHKKQ